MAKRLKLKILENESLRPEAIRSLWQLRVNHLTLNKSEEGDYQYFSQFITAKDSLVMAFYDPQDTLQGFFTIAFMPFDFQKKKSLLLHSKYFYFNKAYRGHYLTMLAPWYLLPIAFKRFGLRSLSFVTTGISSKLRFTFAKLRQCSLIERPRNKRMGKTSPPFFL